MENGLPSYVLKCVLFRIVEETEAEYWTTTQSIAEVSTLFLNALCDGLAEGVFPHYWIDTINVLEDIDDETMGMLRNRAERVCYNPQAYVAANWLELTLCLRHNCCLCGQGGGSNQRGGCNQGGGYPGMKQSCPICLIPASYKDNLCCCGPCPYDQLTNDVY